MVSKTEITRHDQKEQLIGANVVNSSATGLSCLGHISGTDLGYDGGDQNNAAHAFHQIALAGSGTLTLGPLTQGIYEFCIGTDDGSGIVPHGKGVPFKGSDSPTDFPGNLDYQMVCTDGAPYFRFKLRGGQSHINFLNKEATGLSVLYRRLV